MDRNLPRAPQLKRRRSVVNRNFQLRSAFLFLAAATLFALTLLADYYAYFGRSVSSNLLDPGLIFFFLRENKPLVFKLVLFLVIFFAAAVLLTFRIAGPLFSLRRTFGAVKDGNLSHRAKFRERDEFKEVATEFNQMMDEIRDKVAEDRRSAEEMARMLDALSKGAADPAVKKAARDLRERALLLTRRFQLP